MSVIQPHQAYQAIGQLTFSTYGTGGGQVIAINTTTTLAFQEFEGNNTAVISKQANGVMEVHEDGWYEALLLVNKTDGGEPNDLLLGIQYAPGGGTYYNMINWTAPQTFTSTNRSMKAIAIRPLTAGTYVKAIVYNFTNTTRLAAYQYADRQICSLTLRRIG